ncbi:MAG TPA: hypothetical protein VF263_15275, partial [Longimicrobiaceae bacterium]
MGLLDWFRRGGSEGPAGVAVKVRAPSRPADERRTAGDATSRWLWVGLLLAVGFYVAAHYSIATGVWPLHGTAPGAGQTLMRDAGALLAWLLLLGVLRWMGYRGGWALVVLPV